VNKEELRKTDVSYRDLVAVIDHIKQTGTCFHCGMLDMQCGFYEYCGWVAHIVHKVECGLVVILSSASSASWPNLMHEHAICRIILLKGKLTINDHTLAHQGGIYTVNPGVEYCLTTDEETRCIVIVIPSDDSYTSSGVLLDGFGIYPE
jgi:hypothetical protein